MISFPGGFHGCHDNNIYCFFEGLTQQIVSNQNQPDLHECVEFLEDDNAFRYNTTLANISGTTEVYI